ncbi:MAG: TerB family tellurite resistance protein [Bacteroidetes bacterium]|nr:TerB family tellurite resistance protein [Bacteroidota bacterium]
MAKWNKWIAGALGWAMGGPIGGILGFALGAISDEATQNYKPGTALPPNDFSAALLVLCAAVMKADNRLMKTELEYVKKFFTQQFGAAITQQRMLLLREILKQDIPVHEVCQQIKMNVDSSSRLQLLHLLFGIAAADGQVNKDEQSLLALIASLLGINERDYVSLQSMFVKDGDAAYKILEIEKSSGDDDVKKAYRRMAMKYHPDKVHHLGPEYQKDAQEKFKKINEAYEVIKKDRGMN